ncbi:hypothetical protein J4732_19630, partial [Serratia marcescens]|nr:hypothetical protein [Serratia marcescens]
MPIRLNRAWTSALPRTAAVCQASIACFFMPLTTITLSGLPPELAASRTSRERWRGRSVPRSPPLWTQRESQHHSQLTEFVNPYNQQSQEMYRQLEQHEQTTGVGVYVTDHRAGLLRRQIFWLSAGVFLVPLVLVWVAKTVQTGGGGGGASIN